MGTNGDKQRLDENWITCQNCGGAASARPWCDACQGTAKIRNRKYLWPYTKSSIPSGEINTTDMLSIINDDDLANEIASNCHDGDHDSRWCSTCEARADGITEYRERVLTLAPNASLSIPGDCSMSADDAFALVDGRTNTGDYRAAATRLAFEARWYRGEYERWRNAYATYYDQYTNKSK